MRSNPLWTVLLTLILLCKTAYSIPKCIEFTSIGPKHNSSNSYPLNLTIPVPPDIPHSFELGSIELEMDSPFTSIGTSDGWISWRDDGVPPRRAYLDILEEIPKKDASFIQLWIFWRLGEKKPSIERIIRGDKIICGPGGGARKNKRSIQGVVRGLQISTYSPRRRRRY